MEDKQVARMETPELVFYQLLTIHICFMKCVCVD